MNTDRIQPNAAETYVPIVTIYADGSCLRNGSPDSSSGAGAVIIDHNRGELLLRSVYLGSGTNQRAEIEACTNAIKVLRRPCRIEIISDSRYVVDTMAGVNRIKSNRELWDELVRSCYRHHVTWKWLRGHSGNVFHEIADRLSRAAAEARQNLSEADLEELSSAITIDAGPAAIGMVERQLSQLVSTYEPPATDGLSKTNTAHFHAEFAYAPPSAF